MSSRSHQDPDLQEGDNGRMGKSSLSLGLQAPAPTQRWGPAPGDTRPVGPLPVRVRGETPPCPHPTPQRPQPLQNFPGNPPKPLPPRCLLCAKGIEDGMKLLAGKLEVLLGNKLWEPQELLGQAGSAGGLSCWPISATCPEGRREPTVPTASPQLQAEPCLRVSSSIASLSIHPGLSSGIGKRSRFTFCKT